MDTIKSLLLESCLSAHSDDHLLDDFQTIANTRGDQTYAEIFKLLADVEMSPEDARDHWNKVLTHMTILSGLLNRPVSLVAALCDYLATDTTFHVTLKLADMGHFERVLRESTHDGLTGLLNRNFFQDSLAKQIAQARRTNSELTVLFIDIDDFKDINDDYGHIVGDNAIKSIASIIDNEIRESDIAVRYGGEEFVVLMPDTGSLDALILSERIRLKVSKHPELVEGENMFLSVSGGLASFPSDAEDADQLIYCADSAVYRSKGAGKNLISIFKEDNRRFLRIGLHEPVRIRKFEFSETDEFIGMSKDICIGGILFESKTNFELGSMIQLSIQIQQDEPLILIGVVVRVEIIKKDRYDIGMMLSFKEMDKLAKTEIAQLLLGHLRGGGVTEEYGRD